MNRLKHQIDALGVHTDMTYDPADNLTIMKDRKGNQYLTDYDALNRRKSMTYPATGQHPVTTEAWTYDTTGTGNLSTYTNRDGGVQTYAAYDNRNRVKRSAGTSPATLRGKVTFTTMLLW